jgi:hypothetical protein
MPREDTTEMPPSSAAGQASAPVRAPAPAPPHSRYTRSMALRVAGAGIRPVVCAVRTCTPHRPADRVADVAREIHVTPCINGQNISPAGQNKHASPGVCSSLVEWSPDTAMREGVRSADMPAAGIRPIIGWCSTSSRTRPAASVSTAHCRRCRPTVIVVSPCLSCPARAACRSLCSPHASVSLTGARPCPTP